MSTDDRDAPSNALTARRLLREVVFGFARQHGGRFEHDDAVVEFDRIEDTLELARLLYAMHCSSVIVTLRPFHCQVSWQLPIGA